MSIPLHIQEKTRLYLAAKEAKKIEKQKEDERLAAGRQKRAEKKIEKENKLEMKARKDQMNPEEIAAEKRAKYSASKRKIRETLPDEQRAQIKAKDQAAP